MTESLTLQAQCNSCKHTWLPYGRFQKIRVPHGATVTCPNCDYQQEITWLDSETQTKLAQKQLHLDVDNETSRKISDLEYKVQLLEKEVELEQKKREIFEVQLEKMTDWADDREQDFLQIEILAEEINDEDKFKEDYK